MHQNAEYRFDWSGSAYKSTSDRRSGSNSPRKKQPTLEKQPILIQQIYSPLKQLAEDEEHNSSNRKSEQKNSLVVNNLLPERLVQRHKSTSSFNEEQYSDLQPDGSVMIAFQKAIRFGSFHGNTESAIVLGGGGGSRNRSSQQKAAHKMSLDIRHNSIAELNLGLLRQLSMGET